MPSIAPYRNDTNSVLQQVDVTVPLPNLKLISILKDRHLFIRGGHSGPADSLYQRLQLWQQDLSSLESAIRSGR